MSCRITYVCADGRRLTVDAAPGLTVMSAALRAGVPGIAGKCRGNCTCVTCHIYVHPDWRRAAGVKSEMEDSMLDFAEDVTPDSRLACQIPAAPDLDGLEVFIPGQRVLGL